MGDPKEAAGCKPELGSGTPLSRVNEIDGLRAIAMTMVIAQHCSLAPFGWTGVWLFFVISGYVITRNFVQDAYPDGTPLREYRIFMLRRVFRIIPVYFLYVSAVTITILAFGDTNSLKELPFLLTFTYNWQMIFEFWPTQPWPAFGHLWTLSIEEQFYVVYPLLFLFLPRRRYLITITLLVAAGPLIRWGYSSGLATVSNDAGWLAFAIYAASFAQFDAFLIGALIANYETRLREKTRLFKLLAGITALAAIAFVSVYVVVNKANGAAGVDLFRNIISGILYGEGREIWVYAAVDLAAATVVVAAILRLPLIRPLGWKWLAYIGKISYGGYLFHALIIWLIAHFLTTEGIAALSVPLRVFWFAAAWMITVLLAHISYRYFEQPLIAWSKRIR